MRRLMREISFVLEDREKGNWKNGKTQLKEEVNTEGKKKQIYHKGCVETIDHFSRPTSHIWLNSHFSFSEDSSSDTIHITALVQ